MNEKQVGLLVIGPMIIGTAILLYRHHALGLKAVAAVTVAVIAVAGFMFVTL